VSRCSIFYTTVFDPYQGEQFKLDKYVTQFFRDFHRRKDFIRRVRQDCISRSKS